MIRLLSLLPLALAMLVGCSERAASDDAGANDDDRLTIVASTGMVADVVRAVAGDRARVTALMGPGVDPHLYKPTRADIQALLDADAIFANGLLLEGRMADTFERAAASGKPVIAVAERIDGALLLAPGGFEGHPDPHVWMDPVAWSQTVGIVRDALAEHDPPGESVYRERAEAYAGVLTELDAYAGRVLGSVPEDRRILVTAHDAFNYFGERYGYEVVGIQGISTQSEAGVRDIQRIVDLLVDRRIPAVFVESTVSERNVRALIDNARAKGHTVTIGGELFSDAMGDPDAYEGTYVGMIDHNVTTIARALGGEAPERGMRGRLSP